MGWEYAKATGKLPYEGHEPSFDCSNQPWENHQDMERMGANASPFPFYDSKKDECLTPPTTSKVVREPSSPTPSAEHSPWCANPPSCTIRNMNNLEELEEYLLGGYCAWEYAKATGKLPD